MFVDSSRNEKGSGAEILIRGPNNVIIEYALRFAFPTTNNETEYEAMVAGLVIVQSLGINRIWVKEDSKLIIDQVKGICGVYVEIRQTPAYEEATSLPVLEEPKDWRTSIARYLLTGQLPESITEARKIKNHSLRFYVYGKELYKKSWDGPLLSCVSQEDIPKILAKIHQGWCGSHIGGRSLAVKITRIRYFWPTLVKDAMNFVKKYDVCERMGSIQHQPTTSMTPILNPVPFAMWGIDLVGKLPKAKGSLEYVVVVVDYFSK
ncbi:hypothetical protein LIER_09123 [Lithospermum erythrorhizon]|uniref:Integrase catalytic domain-containing protein n=1 Tax=Lithospermum erythrorhizon TaxID=34254 RepID=A0AAV3PEE9_LITER